MSPKLSHKIKARNISIKNIFTNGRIFKFKIVSSQEQNYTKQDIFRM